jgi:hypothetical protein
MEKQEAAMVGISGEGKHCGAAVYAVPLTQPHSSILPPGKPVQLMQVHPSAVLRLGGESKC